MKVFNITVVLILGMISALHCIPIEVVYTGDSCDCPKALNYIVNAPPPPQAKEYTPGEHGYKLDVPVPSKARVTYSFDFTVEEPKPPTPVEEEKWNLFAKVDRITAHRKDCIAPKHKSCSSCTRSSTCTCDRCATSRNSRYRYVTPAIERAFIRRRSSQAFEHPNSLSKQYKTRKPFTTLAWAALVRPINDQTPIEATPMLKSRRKRSLSKFFGFNNRRTQSTKRPERLVKQYNKSLKEPAITTTEPKFGQYFKDMPKLLDLGIGGGKRPFAKLHSLITPPLLRHRRDIKGEYDLLEKERKELDLTLPEIIQFMPETLNPNFKRGQCQFACHSQPAQEEPLSDEDSNQLSDETTIRARNILTTEGTTEQTDTTTDINSSDNAIKSPPTKRQVIQYGCGYVHPFDSPPPPPPGYSLEPYSRNPDITPRPFSPQDSPYGHDPAPQQYVGLPMTYTSPAPVVTPPTSPRAMYDDEPYGNGPMYRPTSPGYYPNPELDRIIAEIVGRHSDFIEATSHEGGALVDSSKVQKQNTKAFFKALLGGQWHKWFQDDASHEHDRIYSYAPPLPPPPPHAYPQQYSSYYSYPQHR